MVKPCAASHRISSGKITDEFGSGNNVLGYQQICAVAGWRT
jgi:hypothetical protein